MLVSTQAPPKGQEADGPFAAQEAFAQLIPPIQRALKLQGYTAPTPIQAQSIPGLLQGRDLIGIAQTGTGKTAAFVLPMLNRLAAKGGRPSARHPRALVLAPTRELAVQIADSCKAYGRYLQVSGTMAYGGMSQYPQVRDLRQGKDILVATPGRLLDLMRQGHLFLDEVECFVLDEVDRMLDMGFIDDIREVVKAMPAERQTMFFSATMPPKTEALAREMVTDPLRVEIVPEPLDTKRIQQQLFFVQQRNKLPLLLERLGAMEEAKVLVFAQKKVDAERVSEALWQAGLRSTAIHGDKTQRARDAALEGFKRNRFRILVATDVAARGLDVDDITHVINFDMPLDPETYMHRIGRTGRAGRTGHAESFAASGERAKLRNVERLLGQHIEEVLDQAFHCSNAERACRPPSSKSKGKSKFNGKHKSQGRGYAKPAYNKQRLDRDSSKEQAPWNNNRSASSEKRPARDQASKPSRDWKDAQAPARKPKYDAAWIDAPKAQPSGKTKANGKASSSGKAPSNGKKAAVGVAGQAQGKPTKRKERPAWQVLLEQEAQEKHRRRKKKSPHRNKPWEAMYQ